jgi:hypothetical protein
MFKVEYVIKNKGSTVAAFISGEGQTRAVPVSQFSTLRGKLSNAIITADGILRGLPGSGGLPVRMTDELKRESQSRKQGAANRRQEAIAMRQDAAVKRREHQQQAAEITRQRVELSQEDSREDNDPDTLFTVLVDMVRSLQNSEFANSFLLKGAFVLMSAVKQAGIDNLIRGTKDIDMNFSSLEIWERFAGKLPEILNRGTQANVQYRLVRRRGVSAKFQSDRLQFRATVGNASVLVGIDMNVKPLHLGTAQYVLPELSFIAVDLYAMLADKLRVLSERTLLRRIKDLTDVYVISKLRDFSLAETVATLKTLAPAINYPVFLLGGNHVNDVQQAYSSQNGMRRLDVPFDEVFKCVLNFSIPVYQGLLVGRADKDAVWSTEKGRWGYVPR